MTTQPETPVVERVSRIEGIVEQINLRLAENHDGIQALSEKIDAETKSLSAKIDVETKTLNEKIDAQGKALSEKIDAQGRELNEKIDRLRIEMHRQTLILGGVLGGLMALFRFLG